MMISKDDVLTEQHISDLVRRFYERAMEDGSLRPIFEATIHDWDAHHRVVEDFWSRTLLNTNRYQGTPYSLHARLPIRPEHFDTWLALFRETALEVLPDSSGRTGHQQNGTHGGSLQGGHVPRLRHSSWAIPRLSGHVNTPWRSSRRRQISNQSKGRFVRLPPSPIEHRLVGRACRTPTHSGPMTR